MKRISKIGLKGFILGAIFTTLLISTPVGAGVKDGIDVVLNPVKIFINGEKQEMDNLIYKGKTYIPIRDISEKYDKRIHWDERNRTVNIYDKQISQGDNYDRISEYLKLEAIETYSKYYELLDFQISNYEEKEINGKVEATFFYRIIEKNYDKDPNTVGYIKELKESGHQYYEQLYDEYLEPRVGNYEFKIVIDENDNITLFSNESPKGVEWVETEMTDFIIKDPK